MNSRYFHSKILLFGEYSILAGSDAAVVPFRKFKARLRFVKECRQPDMMLQSFLEYLSNDSMCAEFLDLSKFERHIIEGISIESDIPMNKGLGSSGAICAGVLCNYGRKDTADRALTRELLSHMESWFHGKSSGIDPLCIYYNKPVIKKYNKYLVVSDDHSSANNSYRPFLIDTGEESKTRPLVDHFRDRLGNNDFATIFTKRYVPLVNMAVDQWMNGNLAEQTVFALSGEQLTVFEQMIPHDYAGIWEKGIRDKLFALKLCGSGGGMLLGFSAEMEETRRQMKEKYGIDIIIAESGEQAVITD